MEETESMFREARYNIDEKTGKGGAKEEGGEGRSL